MLEFKDKSDAKIGSFYDPPDKLRDDLREVYKRFNDMRNGRYVNGQSVESLWEKWEKQYESWRPVRSGDDWQSNIVPPFTTTIVERALAEMAGQTIRPKVTARGPEDKPKAKLLNHVVDYTWEIGDGDIQIFDSLKQLLVLGKTIWQEDYYIDKKGVKILKKFDPEKGIEEYAEKDVYEFNNVYGEKVDLWDFFVDPNARTINRGRYKAKDCIRKYTMDYDMFMETFKGSIWDQFGATKHVRPSGSSPDFWRYYDPTKGIMDNEVEIMFYWSRVPDKNIIVANDVIIKDSPNPYNHKMLPFAEGSDVKRLSGFYARGEPELLESVQDELTTIRRMRIDRQHLDIFKTIFASNREILNEEENVVHPDAFIFVDDPGSVKALEYGDINESAYREEAILKEDGREVTGITSPEPSSTATEAAIFKESTMKTLQMKVWALSRELMTDIIRLRVPNIVQFYSSINAERIAGSDAKNFRTRTISTQDVKLEISKSGELVEKMEKGQHFFDITPDMITPQYGGYDLKMTAEPTFPLSKPLMQQKVGEFLQHPVVAAALQNGYWDINKAADKLAEVNEFDPDEFKSQTDGMAAEEPVIDEETLYEMANRENEIMSKGTPIPGTAYATPQHTQIHLAFMDSEEFSQAVKSNKAVAEAFTNHILAETKAQELRQQGTPQGTLGQGQPQIRPQNESQGIFAGEAKAANPSKVLGPELTPQAME